jgi:hypothetical protein
MAQWRDTVEFEVLPVLTSAEAVMAADLLPPGSSL